MSATPATALAVPRAFLTLAADVACHREPSRWDTLYRVLWRLTHGERHLLEVYVDEDVHALHAMAKAVRREGHKLRAFVRFRLVGGGTAHERYVAWFEPEQDVVEREAPFFARRFPAMRWSILTPGVAAHWDGESLRYAPGVSRLDAPDRRRPGDALAHLLRQHLQPGAREAAHDARRDAGAILEAPARSVAHRAAPARRARPRAAHDRAGAPRSPRRPTTLADRARATAPRHARRRRRLRSIPTSPTRSPAALARAPRSRHAASRPARRRCRIGRCAWAPRAGPIPR